MATFRMASEGYVDAAVTTLESADSALDSRIDVLEANPVASWGSITGTLSNQSDLNTALGAKQATLVSATNIKTINGSSVLGSGDLTVSGSAAWGSVTGTIGDQTDLQDALSATKAAVWPVGSVFVSVVSTNPATLLGFGTWSAFGAGKVMVGLDSGDTDFDTAEETGGAKTKAISAHAGTAVADHASHTHTYTQVPNHVHGLTTVLRTATTGAATTQVAQATDTSSTADATRKTDNPDGGVATGTTNGPSATLTHSVTQPSDHSALNVVQPYIVCYFFKRTA